MDKLFQSMFWDLATLGSCSVEVEKYEKAIAECAHIAITPKGLKVIRQTTTGLTLEKFEQAVQYLSENQITLEELQNQHNAFTRMTSNPGKYYREEKLKRDITNTIKTHGYYQQRQGMLRNEKIVWT